MRQCAAHGDGVWRAAAGGAAGAAGAGEKERDGAMGHGGVADGGMAVRAAEERKWRELTALEPPYSFLIPPFHMI